MEVSITLAGSGTQEVEDSVTLGGSASWDEEDSVTLGGSEVEDSITLGRSTALEGSFLEEESDASWATIRRIVPTVAIKCTCRFTEIKGELEEKRRE